MAPTNSRQELARGRSPAEGRAPSSASSQGQSQAAPSSGAAFRRLLLNLMSTRDGRIFSYLSSVKNDGASSARSWLLFSPF